ncbi:MAG: CDP-diacylglycerol--glycerol-3-phosphate 3-phosphatidyltransferase [Thermodesulfobacteriota bacterium]
MFNLANKLTLLRILAIPVIVLLLYFESRLACFVAAAVFVVASLTDMIDGIVARRQNMVTNFGKFLDPLADKLLIGSVLIMLADLQWVPAWVVVVIVCRELTVTGLRAAAMEQGLVLAADRYGKLKTILQTIALIPLILHYPLFGVDLAGPGVVLLYLALFMTVFSGANYLYNFYRNWLYEGNARK